MNRASAFGGGATTVGPARAVQIRVGALKLGSSILAQGTMQTAGEKVDNAADATKKTAKKAATGTSDASE